MRVELTEEQELVDMRADKGNREDSDDDGNEEQELQKV